MNSHSGNGRTMSGRRRRSAGFTLLELVLVVSIIAVLAAIALPQVSKHREKAIFAKAIADIAMIGSELQSYDPLPETLADIGRDTYLDPWGNPYQYVPIRGTGNAGYRKDRFLVPLNSDFDLYSMGPDGRSVAPLTAPQSLDDIVRANNGGFVGLATDY